MAVGEVVPKHDRKPANDVTFQIASAFVAVWKIRVPVGVVADGLESGQQQVAV